jgi:quercetin dioxygenase-like cupin family protein
MGAGRRTGRSREVPPIPPAHADHAAESPRLPEVLARLDALLSETPSAQGGALWRLDPPGRQLDANVIRLAPGAGVAAHVEPDLDVLLFIVEGAGRLDTEAGPRELAPGCVTWMPCGARRAMTAGAAGLVFLTVHRRRPGLSVRTGTAEPEGGEAACQLTRVCPDCGRFSGESGARYCARCGARLPAA